jgi:hypothetical protein
MPKFYVHLKVEVDRLVLIEAEDEEDAAELAKEGKGEVEEETEGTITVDHVEEGE